MSAASEAARDPLIGERVAGRYLIERVHSRGGMSVVYAALHELQQRQVALKVLDQESAADPEAVDRFLTEARTASSLSHGHVVGVSEFGRLPDGRPYLVMPMIAGTDMASLLSQEGPQPPRRVAALLAGVASALDAMHEKGLVHRDIKSENLMHIRGEDGTETVLVLDFGIAAPDQSERAMMEDGSGTPEFMAPEVLAGEPCDYRGDVYSLATVVFELLTGSLPFEGDDLGQLLYNKATGKRRTLSDASGWSFTPAVETVLARGLAQDPTQRPRSAGELLRQLEAAAASEETTQIRPHRRHARSRTLLGTGKGSRAADAAAGKPRRPTRRSWSLKPDAEPQLQPKSPSTPEASEKSGATVDGIAPALRGGATSETAPTGRAARTSSAPPIGAPPPAGSQAAAAAKLRAAVTPALVAAAPPPAAVAEPVAAPPPAAGAAAIAETPPAKASTSDASSAAAADDSTPVDASQAAASAAPQEPAGAEALAGLFDGVDMPAPREEPLLLGFDARTRALLEDSLRPPPDIELEDVRALRAGGQAGRSWMVYAGAAAIAVALVIAWIGSRNDDAEPASEIAAKPAADAVPAAASSAPPAAAAAKPEAVPAVQAAPQVAPSPAAPAEPAPVAAARQPAAPPAAAASPATSSAAASAPAKPTPAPAKRPAAAARVKTTRASAPTRAQRQESAESASRATPAVAEREPRAERPARPEPEAKPQRTTTAKASAAAKAPALTQQGTDAMLRGDFAAASAAFQQAIEADPRHAPAYRGKGLVLERQNRSKDAVRAFKQFLKLTPSAPGADKIRARVAVLESQQ